MSTRRSGGGLPPRFLFTAIGAVTLALLTPPPGLRAGATRPIDLDGMRTVRPTGGEDAAIHVDERTGVVRVDAKEGPVFIRQIQRAGPGEPPYPRCLECHGDLENATINMGGMELDCTFCHGGDPDASDIETAHIHPDGTVVYDSTVPPRDLDLAYQQFVNPSNLRVVNGTCGICHFTPASRIHKSMMATAAGHYAGGLYQNDVVDTKTPIYGTFAITDDDGEVPVERGAVASLEDLLIYSDLVNPDPELVSTHFAAVPSQACARCHLWSRGKGYRGAEGQDGVYRADGCAACHMLYADDGFSQSGDPTIDHQETGHPIHHVVTKQITTNQCLHCHHRGARIGLNFTGRAQMPPRLPSGPGVPGTTDVRFNTNYHYTVPDTNPQDIHGELGMHCIDCHVGEEVMGDGNIYGHMDQATVIECRTCHGLPGEFPTLFDNSGRFLPNVAVEQGDPPGNDQVILTSKVTGAEHTIPLAMDAVANNPNASCAMNANHLKADGGLECYACHAAWVPNCFGCHFERDERFQGLNFMTGEFETGRVRTNNKVFETLRHFALGPNSEGRVAPYLVACQPIADVTAPDGSKILDFKMPETTNGLSGLAHNPVNPHTIRGRGEVRSCSECHRAPPSLGLGSGNYTLARDRVYTAGSAGVRIYDRESDPAQPELDGSLPGRGAALAVTSLPNVVEGTADVLYVARGQAGVSIYDRRPDAPPGPVALIRGVNAIDVARAARYLYVVDLGVGIRIYDNDDPTNATFVATVPITGALRVVPWGIHLFVAAGTDGLFIVDIADHDNPYVTTFIDGINAVDVRPYAHYQAGSDFAVHAYVADPGYGIHVVDLLPDFEAAQVIDGLPLSGAVALDAYTHYKLASATEPSREHDYLYAAAGPAGLHVFDMTNPRGIVSVASVTDLGGTVVDVDVVSQLAPPGTDDYALLVNEASGLQVVRVDDPEDPVTVGTVPGSVGASRLFVEVQPMDRYLDEQGGQLKENSHPFTDTFTREDIVRILSASTECESTGPDPDLDGDGEVEFDDLLILLSVWGPCPDPPDPCPADLDGDGEVGIGDLLQVLSNWG